MHVQRSHQASPDASCSLVKRRAAMPCTFAACPDVYHGNESST
ncbi:hypothetical protein BTH_I2170 [Burkholderia thailandensis E264]|uniref:Uncharacterized protein n=1 Tax=Burkholderia thailandensis (strain ATCC 700388 / DSM 13276 / CCUG 48851 / CIP 106301 / E264) TaxID=271848 RepID=Q2SWK8_BURTA|nr:hypothetical protein BTH_I2170 [Burkholderia thailandensis E264]